MSYGDEVIDEAELEYSDLEFEVDKNAYSPGRLLSIGLAGAAVSLGIYYLYQQLDPEKKHKLKKRATGFIQEQIHALTEVRDDY